MPIWWACLKIGSSSPILATKVILPAWVVLLNSVEWYKHVCFAGSQAFSEEKKHFFLFCDCHLKNSAPIPHLNNFFGKGSLMERKSYLPEAFKKKKILSSQSNLKADFPLPFCYPFCLSLLPWPATWHPWKEPLSQLNTLLRRHESVIC